jgi:DNA-binding transcriptional MerR regulator
MEVKKMLYTIGEMAKKMKVAPSTLRYYDSEGLLPFVERSSGGMRVFKERDLGALEIIDCLKRTGMPIKNIKAFMDYSMEGDSTIDKRLEIILNQKTKVVEQIKELEDMLNMLNYKEFYYETAKREGSCKYAYEMPLEDIPKKFHKYIHRD